MTDRVLKASDVIFDKTKIGRKSLLEIVVLTEVLRAIDLYIDTEVTEHNDSYLSKELVNKEHIQGIDQPLNMYRVILMPVPIPAPRQP
jgi:hypothetical protein